MDSEEKQYWLAFSAAEVIGPARFKLLVDYFGSAKAAFLAPTKDLLATGLSVVLVDRLNAFRKNFNYTSYFVRLEKLGVAALCDVEENYPKLLKEISDRPFVLYIKSLFNSPFEKRENIMPSKTENIASLLSSKEGMRVDFERKGRGGFRSIAVVGTRKMTLYGQQATAKITQDLVKAGFIIVSGLARGVDKVAHQTAIINKGLTVAVCGTGLETIYPPEHQALAEQIVESGGVLLSEVPLAGTISKGTFRFRNRIISGLALGVVVTEAAEISGSLLTASYAAEQGREVFAVPGPINSPGSAGTAALIKKGAKLVYTVQDILEEL